MLRRWLPLCCLLLAGCSQSPAVGSTQAPPAARAAGHLYLAPGGAGTTISVVDAATGAALRTLPAGAPSPDWRWLYAITRHAVQVVDPGTGNVAAQATVPDWASTVRTSANGRWLVLTESPSAGSTTSRFYVLGSAATRRYCAAHPQVGAMLLTDEAGAEMEVINLPASDVTPAPASIAADNTLWDVA